MRRLTIKRFFQAASLILTCFTILFGVLWAVKGLRPAIQCGVLDALWYWDWAAAYACIDKTDFEAVLFVISLAGSAAAWIASRLAPDTPLGEYTPTPIEHERNRQTMINRVWKTWIEENLDQALYQAVPMRLGMTLRASVPRPGSVRLRQPGEEEHPVAADVSNVELFDGAQHKLLILGKPGAGKTTTMLDLARALLKQARSDASIPIPVVFDISSLTEPKQTLDDWLVGECRRNYQVPEKVARYWLAHEELALLLDGLDEVRPDRRAGVVEKIGQYRSQHMDPWLVICCRSNEYAEISAAGSALKDIDAVVLQPLTRKQANDYLAGLDGPEPQRLWNALQSDAALLEVADTPLMLNVMLLAADELDWDVLPSDRGPEAVRSHIYDAYIRSVLARPRSAGPRYPVDKALHWLHWLAGKMITHGQTVFLLERMRRSWFNQSWQRFIWVPVFWLPLGLLAGLLIGLEFQLTIGAYLDRNIRQGDWGLFWLFFGLLFGLLYGLFAGLIFGLSDLYVQEQIRLRFDRRRLLFGLACCFVVGLPSGLLFGWFFGSFSGLLAGLLVGLYFGLIIWLDVGWPGEGKGGLFKHGLIDVSTELEKNYRERRPNAATHQSLRNGLIFGLIFGLFSALIGAPLFGLFFGPSSMLSSGLISALLGWMIFGLAFGLDAVIKHYTLRLVLYLDGSMPLRYVRFLDYCVDRVLLRRVGGGYMFIHRTMMEHIAGLDLEGWRQQPDSP